MSERIECGCCGQLGMDFGRPDIRIRLECPECDKPEVEEKLEEVE